MSAKPTAKRSPQAAASEPASPAGATSKAAGRDVPGREEEAKALDRPNPASSTTPATPTTPDTPTTETASAQESATFVDEYGMVDAAAFYDDGAGGATALDDDSVAEADTHDGESTGATASSLTGGPGGMQRSGVLPEARDGRDALDDLGASAFYDSDPGNQSALDDDSIAEADTHDGEASAPSAHSTNSADAADPASPDAPGGVQGRDRMGLESDTFVGELPANLTFGPTEPLAEEVSEAVFYDSAESGIAALDDESVAESDTAAGEVVAESDDFERRGDPDAPAAGDASDSVPSWYKPAPGGGTGSQDSPAEVPPSESATFVADPADDPRLAPDFSESKTHPSAHHGERDGEGVGDGGESGSGEGITGLLEAFQRRHAPAGQPEGWDDFEGASFRADSEVDTGRDTNAGAVDAESATAHTNYDAPRREPKPGPREASGQQPPRAPSWTASVAGVSVNRRAVAHRASDKDTCPVAGGGMADYELRGLLGEGGMGRVLAARQTSIDRAIAIKQIKPQYTRKRSELKKFVSEAVVTGDLDHPNIVPIYDLAVDDRGLPFYAMKQVRGTPWDEVMRELSLEENLDILMDVADAVAFAHSKDVIHRDLKPENVMLGEFGEVMVMDWGLAASVGPQGKAVPIEKLSGVAGTPAYMAPEMAAGDKRAIGFVSDVYLLGGILYELVTGKRPHAAGSTLKCIMAAAENVIQPTKKRGELVEIARRAMDGDPARRYGTVKEFQRAIRTYLSHRESVNLTHRAREDLEEAEASANYEAFGQALFGFREALDLWPENREAEEALIEAELAYAECAFGKGDFDLALSLLDEQEPSHRELALAVRRAAVERDARSARIRLFKRIAMGLALTIIVVLTVAYILIDIQRRRALRAEKEERAAKQVAQQQRERAKAEWRRAESEKERAETEKVRAEAEAARARKAEALQTVLRERAERARARAVEEEQRARKLFEELAAAVEARDQAKTAEEKATAERLIAEAKLRNTEARMAKQRELEDSSWWALTREEAARKQQAEAEALLLPVRRDIAVGDGAPPLEMVLIPAGAFVMGSPSTDLDRMGEEHPHRVEIATPFYMTRHELTEAQWAAITGAPPPRAPNPKAPADGSPAEAFPEAARETRGEQPVVNVSWAEIEATLLPALVTLAPPGTRLRLPTEAEWEYACRAGAPTPYNLGPSPADLQRGGWYRANSEGRLHAVGQLTPNAWGLYDMHGNVAEICMDQYEQGYYLKSPAVNPYNAGDGKLRVTRGGGHLNLAQHCRSAYRSNVFHKKRYFFIGLRLALELTGAAAPGGSGDPGDSANPDEEDAVDEVLEE